ncbi:MAG TPA: RNA pyrophosphohydrolase, partial [Pseudoxanthomonas sp.]|nr:RNA pyrophosphohydrolase [Pseudoxanthomonas sp.]
VWFLLRLVGDESHLRLDLTETPEFDHWRWVDFWYPMEHVVMFKRGVYARALRHLAPFAQLVAGTQAVPQLLMNGWISELDHARPARQRRTDVKRGGILDN